MRKFLKKEACAAIPVFFEDDVLSECKQEIEKNSRLRRYWDEWTSALRNKKEVVKYLTSAEEDKLADITHQKRRAFRMLRLLKLKRIIPHVKNEAFLRYCDMLLIFYGKQPMATTQFLHLINKAEIKLVRIMTQETNIEEVQRFVLVSALFADKNYIYDQESKALYQALCHRVKEANL